MKTKFWAAILAAVLLLCAGASVLLLSPGGEASAARILSGGKLVRTVDLGVDQEFTVTTEDGGYNIITVRDGKIAVTEASCPDHYCEDRGFCSGGAQIVCLPNRLVIEFTEEQEIDGVIGLIFAKNA